MAGDVRLPTRWRWWDRWMRRGWRVLAVVMAVPTLLVGGCQAVAVLASDDRTEVAVVDAAEVAIVDVENGAGSVRIVGAPDADTVRVTSRIRDGLRPTHHRVGMEGDRLVVRARCPVIASTWCRAAYTIEVPADIEIDVWTRGEVTVSDVDAAIAVEAVHGSVTLERLGGAVVARAGHGRIDGADLAASTFDASADHGSVGARFRTSPRAVSVRTDHGAIELALPDEPGVAYALDASSGHGTVTTLVATDPRSDRTLALRTRHGSITTRYG